MRVARMASREKIRQSVRTSIFMRSIGHCEYGACGEIAARWSNGHIEMIGELCHILPVNDGSRSEFKASFPHVDLDSENNLMLLCRKHHHLIDQEKPSEYPPAILFQMVMNKARHVARFVDDLFQSSPFRFDHHELAQDVRVGRIYDLMNEATLSGPKEGRSLLREAERVLGDIALNPLVETAVQWVELARLELKTTSLENDYSSSRWEKGLQASTALLRKIADARKVPVAVSLMLLFLRDEYSVFDTQKKLTLAKALNDKLDSVSASAEDQDALAYILIVKSAVVRWRGRLQRLQSHQESSFSEAERCAKRSLSLVRSSSALLQSLLVEYSKARLLPLRSVAEYDERIAAIGQSLEGPELLEYGASAKYRPIFYRQTFQYTKSIDAFWKGIDFGFRPALSRVAYVIGEASTAAYSQDRSRGLTIVNDALSFLSESLRQGFDHAHNFKAWIACRSIVDEEWFDVNLLSKFETDLEAPNQLANILTDARRRFFGQDAFGHDVLFGVDEAEFWTMLGTLTARCRSDLDLAMRFFERANRYGGHKFPIHAARVRACLHVKRLEEARAHLVRARSVAGARYGSAIADLEASLARLEELPGLSRSSA